MVVGVAGVVAVALLAVLGVEVIHRDGKGFDSCGGYRRAGRRPSWFCTNSTR